MFLWSEEEQWKCWCLFWHRQEFSDCSLLKHDSINTKHVPDDGGGGSLASPPQPSITPLVFFHPEQKMDPGLGQIAPCSQHVLYPAGKHSAHTCAAFTGGVTFPTPRTNCAVPGSPNWQLLFFCCFNLCSTPPPSPPPRARKLCRSLSCINTDFKAIARHPWAFVWRLAVTRPRPVELRLIYSHRGR